MFMGSANIYIYTTLLQVELHECDTTFLQLVQWGLHYCDVFDKEMGFSVHASQPHEVCCAPFWYPWECLYTC